MCTYLYAAFSLKDAKDGLCAEEAAATARWRRVILEVAIEEMGHFCAVWNITSALGGAPRFGRGNFPLGSGLSAGGRGREARTLQRSGPAAFHLSGAAPRARPSPTARASSRRYGISASSAAPRLTPMGIDYDTVGDFYASLGEGVTRFVERARRESRVLRRSGAAAVRARDRSRRRQAGHLRQDRARGLRCDRAPGRRRAGRQRGLPLPEVRRHPPRVRGRSRRRTEAFSPRSRRRSIPCCAVRPAPRDACGSRTRRLQQCVDLANAAYGLMARLIAYSYGLRAPPRESARSRSWASD